MMFSGTETPSTSSSLHPTTTATTSSTTTTLSSFSTLLGSTLESLIHELLHSRNIYPPDSFVLYRHLGVRCHASRVPPVCDYIANFLRVAVPCIVNGIGDYITLVILEEETSGGEVDDNNNNNEVMTRMAQQQQQQQQQGLTTTVERFVFHFEIDNAIDHHPTVKDRIRSSCWNGPTEIIETEIIGTDNMEEMKKKTKMKKEAVDFDDTFVNESRAHMERSMRELLLSTLVLRKRRRRPKEKAENMSFKLCLHIIGEEHTTTMHEERGGTRNKNNIRDSTSIPEELIRVLNQGEWLVPEQSSCYFPYSNNNCASATKNEQTYMKGMLRPIKDINLPSCGMKMQLGMEVMPSFSK